MVEATIVFPVMFLVIFLMLFAGNAYVQKCRIDSYVSRMALKGAACCADPSLLEVSANKLPSYETTNVRPYRYLFGGMSDVESSIATGVKKGIKGMSTGLFSGMKPSDLVVETNYNNGFIYSSFSVEVQCKICIPVRLLGASDYIYMNISSRADMPVSDTTEFIRNVDMVDDYLERYGIKAAIEEKITTMVDAVKKWMK